MNRIIDEIVRLANAEWEFFGKQEFDVDGRKVRDGMDETEDGFWQRVGIYWRDGTGKNLTGKNDDFPWSATFISYLMRKAGAADRFKYNALHSVYIRAAIKARERGNKAYGFWGFRLAERPPEIGDLVCYSREAGISFDTQSTSYKSHSDVVVGRSERAIQVIGGNVGNSVSRKTLKLDNRGLLTDQSHDWFCVLQNRLDTANS
ncbi:MAG: DUF2272 domain-containing protein [Rhodobacteraceae bacterium]|nr:DUF2272 domain-containing protein [Paracoccaceae bacterium]MCB1941558.1 DUF2272 domain-containing protein [Accumulibacter sp.]